MISSDQGPAPSKWRRRILRLLVCLALVAVLATGLYFTQTGKRLLAHGAGLLIHVKKAPVRFALPEPTGPFEIGTSEMHLVDGDRIDPWVTDKTRELMISLWYPAHLGHDRSLAPYMRPAAAAHFKMISVAPLGLAPEDIDLEGVRTHAWENAPANLSLGPLPVLIFSPGGSQSRTLGTLLVEELASQGYVVVTIDHTYEAEVVAFPDGRLEVAALPEGPDTLKKMIEVRVEDVRFVLSKLEQIQSGINPDAAGHALPPDMAGLLDLKRVGMFGHSAGGFTTAEVMRVDDRVDAGVNLDGSLIYRSRDGDFGEVTRVGLDRPFLLIGAGLSGSERMPHTHEHAPDWSAFWQHSTGWKMNVHLPEGEHFSFTDHQVILPQLDAKLGIPQWLMDGMIGTVDPAAAVNATRDYVTAFFDEHIGGEAQALLEGPSPAHPFVDILADR